MPFALDHNVLPVAEAFGECGVCHSLFAGYQPAPVFDRAVLVDLLGPDNEPVYETPRDLTGILLF